MRKMSGPTQWLCGAFALALSLTVAGCTPAPAPPAGGATPAATSGTDAPKADGAPTDPAMMEGAKPEEGAASAAPAGGTTIVLDGSSTVYPISQAVAEAFKEANADVEITVGSSGTGGGMKKFILGEIDICDASRAIKSAEKEECAAKGIEYLELQVAIDGLSVVVHPENNWVDCITIAELKKIWEKGSTVTKWNEVNPAWPAEPIALFGADTDSGTFEYFTEVVNGKAKESRTEYTASANDNVLVTGVSDNKYAMGYFGYGYYVENKDRLKALSIKKDDAAECVAPTAETIETGTYAPMARPLFIYVNKAALKRPEVAKFVEFYLSEAGQEMVSERKFVRMPAAKWQEMKDTLASALK